MNRFSCVNRNTKGLLLSSVAGISLFMSAAVACAQGLPTGAQIVNGQIELNQAGSGLAIRQASPTAIISWEQFSIGQPNSVHFDNGAGATLNRVRGNVASQIDGALTATGSVYLINPAGIAVGSTGRIETGGSFVGSTLDISDEDFQKAASGEAYTLKGTSSATVRNAGRIGSLGGSVVLVAHTVENEGDIDAANGTAALVAGTEVLVQDRSLDGGRFVVKVGGETTSVRNTGNIRAAEAELRANGGNVYALAGNRQGVIAATGVASKGGRVFLTAGDSGTVTVTQRVTARRASSDVNRGQRGGDIRVSGRDVRIAASLDASGVLPPARPDGLRGDGGTVIVSGDNISLEDAARVDVSGARGGIALVGGDYQGGVNEAANYVSEKVATAQRLTVAGGAVVSADGYEGDGGRIVLWSDRHTDFAGHVSATSVSGRGGDAEVSGKATLAFKGTANLMGKTGAGTLLLDPFNLTIVEGDGGIAEEGPFGVIVTADSDNSTLGVDTLTELLATSNVTVTTGISGSQDGNITVSTAITWNEATTLTLEAAKNIIINAAITAVNGGLTLHAAKSSDGSATITTGVDGAINVGTFYLEQGAWVQEGASLPTFAAKDFRILGGHAVKTAPVPGVVFMRVVGGTGDDVDPYQIADVYGLQGMATVRDKHYTLTINIDASGTANWYGGAGFSPIGNNKGAFTGSFDGRGHLITGLTINRPNQEYVGAFGKTNSGATIKNIGMVGGSVIGKYYVGGLTGFLGKGSSIINSYATVSVLKGLYVGGLVGYSEGSISNSYATGSVEGAESIGGLVGYSGGSISNSYATGSVTGGIVVGGLVGDAYNSTISNSYATGLVTGTSNVGGLVGAFSNSDITASYWDIDTTGRVDGVGNGSPSGVTGVYSSTGTVNAFTQETYSNSGWDFSTTWYMVDGETRPFLRMELEELGKTYDASGNVIEDTYTIRNANQLQLINSHEGDASSGKTYILANDIDLTAALANDAGMWRTETTKSATNLYGFVPIGTDDSNAFRGTFDGQGHVIEGLTIHRPDRDNVGLFGYTASATIKNIGVAGGLVTGRDAVSGLVGSSTYNSIISNSHATGLVTGGYAVGGLVGSSTYNSIINNSHATGLVTGEYAVAGLVGYLNNSSIGYSYATGSVTGYNYVGGLVGEAYEGSIISNSHAAGSVTGGYAVGGLVGEAQNISISDSYATGLVTGNIVVGGLVGSFNSGEIIHSYATGLVVGDKVVGGLVGGSEFGNISNSYAMGSVKGDKVVGGLVGSSVYNNVSNSYATGSVTGGYAVGGLVGDLSHSTFSASYWDIDTTGRTEAIGSGGPPIGVTGIRSISDTVNAFTKETYDGFDFDDIWYMVDGETRPFLRMELEELGKTYDASGNVVENTYTIRNANQLQLIKIHEGATSSGKTYILANDIDLTAALANDAGMWRTITKDADATDPYGFVPIGTSTNTFQGTFDGKGNKITGLTIYRPNENYVGLFGYTSATIRNIGVAGGLVTGKDAVGGLVGSSGPGTIINNSYATGAVTANQKAGGLVGHSNISSISTSYATGSVEGKSYAGGLVGHIIGSSINNSYATGSVTITESNGYIGGLVGASGNKSAISNSYASGKVTGTGARVGGLVGNFAGGGTITSSFWNIETTGQSKGVGGTVVAGTTGLTTAQFTNTAYFMSVATGWNFETIWAPPGIGYMPELYALSKVIRVHADGNAIATYGNPAGSWEGRIPDQILYGQDLHVSGDTAYGTPSAFNDTPTFAIGGLNVGSYTAEVTGLDNGGNGKDGYRYIYTAGLTINRATLTFSTTGTVEAGKIYDGTKNANVSNHGILDGVIGSDDVSLTLTASYAQASVGDNINVTGTYALTGLAAGNYKLENDQFSATASITSAILKISADVKTMIYGEFDPVLTYTVVSGLVPSDDESIFTGALERDAGENAGTYAIHQGTLSAGDNYTIDYTDADFTIHRKEISIATQGTVKTEKIYDGTTGATRLTDGTLSGILDADIGGVTLQLTNLHFNSANVAEARVINGLYTLTGAAAGNYALASYGFRAIGKILEATLNINPASGQVKTVGQSYNISYTASGWQGRDNASLLSGALSYEGQDVPGDHLITLGSLAAGGNYKLRLTGGVLSIIAQESPGNKTDEESARKTIPDWADLTAKAERARELQRRNPMLTRITEKAAYIPVSSQQDEAEDGNTSAGNAPGTNAVIVVSNTITFKCAISGFNSSSPASVADCNAGGGGTASLGTASR